MAATAYSYRTTARQQPARRSVRTERPDVRAVPGSRNRNEVKVLPTSLNTIGVAIAVIFIVIAAFAFARVYMSSQAIVTSIASESITEDIAKARSAGSALEVQSSAVANSVAVKDKAAKMGMADPEEVTYIVLPQDVVAVAEDGSLSLSESIARASGSVSGE